jgi:hypothetical protein
MTANSARERHGEAPGTAAGGRHGRAAGAMLGGTASGPIANRTPSAGVPA